MRGTTLSICVLLFVGLTSAKDERTCIQLCTNEYRPVCGRKPNGVRHTFDNECKMKNYNCGHPEAKYELVQEGSCQQLLCLQYCNDEYNPVCGEKLEGDRHTFNSECDMANYNCLNPGAEYELLHNGNCTQTKRSHHCPVNCPLFLLPVCGRSTEGDLMTFSSECELWMFNCRHPEVSYERVSEGSCDQYYETECKKPCGLGFHPVCGQNAEGDRRTFQNACEMQKFNCKNTSSKYSLLHLGNCHQAKRSEDCPVECPAINQPLCARNSVGRQTTFSNECALKIYNCQTLVPFERISDGYCDPAQENCPTVCPRLLMPVCGRNDDGNHRTFVNDCELRKHNCRHHDSQYELLYPGNCNQQKRNEECLSWCPSIFFPVCVRTPEGEHLTYANDCELSIYKCRNPSSGYERVGEGSCDKYVAEEDHAQGECPKWCSREYRPVCGKNSEGDRQTFHNACELKRQNCENADSKYESEHNGSCTPSNPSGNTEECPKTCNYLYRPICGSNSHGHHRSFGNNCEMEIYNCENPSSKYGYLHGGVC